MADLSKLKRRRTLGAPPSPGEASTNLAKPEAQATEARTGIGDITELFPQSPNPRGEGRVDGRSMRRTNRVVQFATRVTPEFDQRVRTIAMEEGLLIVEVLEKALKVYDHQRLAGGQLASS